MRGEPLMLSFLKSIYDKLPKKRLKLLKYIPDRILFGKSYLQWNCRVSFDKNIIDKNLCEILVYARENTKFGKEHIPNDVTIENAKQVLETIPLVSSYDISTNLDYYISKEYKNNNAYLTTTGGTGRNPTSILLSNESYGIEWAHIHHAWSLSNYVKARDLKLTLRGKSLKGDRLIEFNPIYNELVVDTFKVNNSNFKKFIDEIKKYNIKYIHGYPSLLKEYILYFDEYGYKPKIKGVLLASEGASVEEKKAISIFFNARVIHWYGQSEKVTLAVDIDADNLYKVYTSYGYPRIVGGELVATSFVNKALPLINYKMGDGAEIIESENSLYLKSIQSRRGKDFIYLNKDKRVSTTAINLHSEIQNEILYYQIHQFQYGVIEIYILPKVNSDMSHNEILTIFTFEIKEKLTGFDVKSKIVNEGEIVKSHRGKMVFLVQNIKYEGKK